MNDISELKILIVACLFVGSIIAMISAFKPKHHKQIKKSHAVIHRLQQIPYPGSQITYLRKIDPYVFEECILTALEERGIKIKRNSRYSGDGGMDGTFWINKEKYLIQAKRYSGHVSLQHVKDFIELSRKSGCKGIFIHTGKTSKEAKNITHLDSDVNIISGDRLLALLLTKKQFERI